VSPTSGMPVRTTLRSPMATSCTFHDIVSAADRLFYERGYEFTSFRDIADEVRISRGNFYHHFRSKDEILDAVIEARLTATRSMLEQWQEAGKDPRSRIASFIRILLTNMPKIRQHGCPVGTLCTELAKIEHPARARANAVFELFRAWLRRQFESMGAKDADALALHLLARSQGVAVLASTFKDERFVAREVKALLEWLADLETTRPIRRRRASA